MKEKRRIKLLKAAEIEIRALFLFQRQKRCTKL